MKEYYLFLVVAFFVQLPVMGDFMRGGGEFPFERIFATLYDRDVVNGTWVYSGTFTSDGSKDLIHKLYNSSINPRVNQICLQPVLSSGGAGGDSVSIYRKVLFYSICSA